MGHWVFQLKDGSYLAHRKQPKPYARKVPSTAALLGDARVFSSKSVAVNAAKGVFYGDGDMEGTAVQVHVILDRLPE